MHKFGSSLRLLAVIFLVVSVFGIAFLKNQTKLSFFADADTIAPTILDVYPYSYSSNKYDQGDILQINTLFNEPVRTTGSVTMNFSNGGRCTFTVNSSNLGYCSYTVLAGQNTTLLEVASITGVIKDLAGNTLTNFIPVSPLSDTAHIGIDTNPPVIDKITSGSDKVYRTGETVGLQVLFSKNVSSTAVQLTLNSGGTCTFAIINNYSGYCSYIVGASDVNTTLLNVTNITGVIKDSKNRLLTNFIPISNLANERKIGIDTVLPTILSITTTDTRTYLKSGDSLAVLVNFSEPVTGNVSLYFNDGSYCYGYINYNTKSDKVSCTIKISKTSKYTAVLNVDRMTGYISDAALNQMVNFVPVANLSNSKTFMVDIYFPTIQLSTPSGVDGYSSNGYGYAYFYYSTYDNSVYVAGSVADEGSGLKSLVVDGVDYGAGNTFSFTKASARAGSYSSAFSITDLAGNITTGNISVTRGLGNAVCNPGNTLWNPLKLATINVPIWKYVGEKVKEKQVSYETASKKVKAYKWDKKKKRYVGYWKTVKYKKKVVKYVWKYVDKKIKVKESYYVTVNKKVKTKVYDKKKKKYVWVWKTVKVKQKKTRWVWKSANKSLVSSNMNLKVNAKCADTFKQIFTSVYNNPDRQPINPGETACYRKNNPCYACRHDYGVACDINVSQNAAFRSSGGKYTPYAGSFWKPGSKYSSYPGWSGGRDPLSIPPDGAMAKAFDEANFGGQLTGDYMHFSIDGG